MLLHLEYSVSSNFKDEKLNFKYTLAETLTAGDKSTGKEIHVHHSDHRPSIVSGTTALNFSVQGSQHNYSSL